MENAASGGIVLLLLEMEVEMQHQHHQKTRPEGGQEGIVLDGECCQRRHSFAISIKKDSSNREILT